MKDDSPLASVLVFTTDVHSTTWTSVKTLGISYLQLLSPGLVALCMYSDCIPSRVTKLLIPCIERSNHIHLQPTPNQSFKSCEVITCPSSSSWVQCMVLDGPMPIFVSKCENLKPDSMFCHFVDFIIDWTFSVFHRLNLCTQVNE